MSASFRFFKVIFGVAKSFKVHTLNLSYNLNFSRFVHVRPKIEILPKFIPRRFLRHVGYSTSLSLFFWKTDKEKSINEKAGFLKIIEILKKGKVKEIYREYDEAEDLYHEALENLYQLKRDNLATEIELSQTKSYIFDCMANLAFMNNELSKAEGLFKETLKELLFQKLSPNDNAIVEISLKLAIIYAAQTKYEDATLGYMFCIDTMSEKVNKFWSHPNLDQTDENTLALYGMVIEAYSKFLNERNQWQQSLPYLERALSVARKVFKAAHPQVAVISNDLAVVKVQLNQLDEALKDLEFAAKVARECESPDLPVILYNKGDILKTQNDLAGALAIFKEALTYCNADTNEEIVEKINLVIKLIRSSYENVAKNDSVHDL